jgi:hypothetical protein
VSPEAVTNFHKTHPRCRIVSDAGAIEPINLSTDPESGAKNEQPLFAPRPAETKD